MPRGGKVAPGRVYVPASGPSNARLLWVGEAPGKTEELRRVPFVGATGGIVRGALNHGGVPDSTVRFVNAIPYNVTIPSQAASIDRLLVEHAAAVDEELATQRPRVIVACGGVALRRLGIDGPITTWHGAAVPWTCEAWAADGHTAILVPCLHPVGVMKEKLQAGRIAIARAVARACMYANGATLRAPTLEIEHNPGASVVRAILDDAPVVYVDTEYIPATHMATSVQMSADANRIIVIDRWDRATMDALREILTDPTKLKVAQNHTADVESLWSLDIDVAGPWFDTMVAASILYPDLPVGLAHLARFYCDNVTPWKHLDTMDLTYRALDVHYTARVFEAQRAELATHGMSTPFYDEAMPATPLLWGMTARGMFVDVDARTDVQRGLDETITRLRATIQAKVGAMFEGRVAGERAVAEAVAADVARIVAGSTGAIERCMMPKHGTYDGMRRKKWMSDPRCTCAAIYESTAGVRAAAAGPKRERAKIDARASKWERRGFDPGNDHDMRWLLYDKGGLALPKQYDAKTGAVTVNATACAKLAAMSALPGGDDTRRLLIDCKAFKQAERWRETFADPPVDEAMYAHPPYRMQTGTGRVAGGEDAMISDVKGASEFSFNVLNIPDAMRRIYVPDGCDGGAAA